MTPRKLTIGLGMAAALSIGCASKQTLSTSSATAAQRGAMVAGAADVPQATLALQLSKESVERAEALFAAGKRDEAVSQLTRAEADAELAIVLAQAETQKAAALAALARVRRVQSER